jgi:hypothetical protein
MRAREFIIKEDSPSLGDAIRAAALKQANTPQLGQDPNAVKQPSGSQSSQGTVPPGSATTGGTQTPQAANKPAGIGASFISGLTKGKASSIGGMGDLAKQGVKNFAANKLGMTNTVGAINNTSSDPIAANKAMAAPQNANIAFTPGQTIKLPNVGDIKVVKSGPQGIELDTSKAPTIGVPKITLDPRDLLKK